MLPTSTPHKTEPSTTAGTSHPTNGDVPLATDCTAEAIAELRINGVLRDANLELAVQVIENQRKQLDILQDRISQLEELVDSILAGHEADDAIARIAHMRRPRSIAEAAIVWWWAQVRKHGPDAPLEPLPRALLEAANARSAHPPSAPPSGSRQRRASSWEVAG